MNKKTLMIIISVIVLAVLGGYFLMANRPKNEKTEEAEKTYAPSEQTDTTKAEDISPQNSLTDVKDDNSSAPATPVAPTPSKAATLPSPVLKFSAGGCDPNMDPYTEPFEGISNQNWSSDILTINAYVKTLCEGINIAGSYKLSGANLALKIDMTHSGPQGDCYCARALTYKISNLDQKDYQVSITRGE